MGDCEKADKGKFPKVNVIPPNSQAPTTPFADAVTGEPIPGKLPGRRSNCPAMQKRNALDPDFLDNTFERQESRMPTLEDIEKIVGKGGDASGFK